MATAMHTLVRRRVESRLILAASNNIYYHGVTSTSLDSILRDGLRLDSERKWLQSSDSDRSAVNYLSITPEMAMYWAVHTTFQYYRRIKKRSVVKARELTDASNFAVLKVRLADPSLLTRDRGSPVASDFCYPLDVPAKDLKVHLKFDRAGYDAMWRTYRGVGREIEYYD